MDRAVFEARNLGFSYPQDIVALQSLDFRIELGERIAILGANGSGKSTLLKLLDGLLFPSSGELLAFGQPLTEEAMNHGDFAFSFRRQVGLVFQDPDVQLFSATVWDEVAFGPLQLGLLKQEVESRVASALELLGIGELRHRPPYLLSAGEKKKVALASVLVLDPQVLLLDEPTAGLDPRSQGRLLDFLRGGHNYDRTLIAATHDLDIIEELSDKVYVMGEGHRLIAEGSPEAVLADTDFLLRANLIHEHSHFHSGHIHTHPHLHLKFHDHEHRG